MTTITLKKPIQAHGSQVSSLTFREPTGEDIMDAGYPMLVQIDGKKIQMKVDGNALGEMIARLSETPPSSIKKLHHADFNRAAGVVGGFFTESIVELFSTAISKSVATTATSPGPSA